jgi:hypothetical protein
MNYTIILRSGKHIEHVGEVDTITCLGYVRLERDGRECAIYRAADIGKIVKGKAVQQGSNDNG